MELNAARTYVRAREVMSVRLHVQECGAPEGFSPMQRFPRHVVNFIAHATQSFGLLGTVGYSPMHRWPLHLQTKLDGMDVAGVLAHECCTLNVQVRLLRIQHEYAGLGLFAGKNFGKGEVVGYY